MEARHPQREGAFEGFEALCLRLGLVELPFGMSLRRLLRLLVDILLRRIECILTLVRILLVCFA